MMMAKVAKARSWFNDNQTLVYFLIGQAIVLVGAVITGTAYMSTLEARVATLEVRGSPHLEEIDSRLTVLESAAKANKERIDRIVTVMTRELHISPTDNK